MTTNNSTRLTSRIWRSKDGELVVPERELGVGNRTALCFSGGGNRALSATMGYLRGLTELGLMDSVDYISSVSGGTWASAVYTYYNRGAENDAQLLGPVTAPADITMDRLAQLPESCLGFGATRSFQESLLRHWESGTAEDRLWIEAVGETYLEPFGLHDPEHHAHISWNDDTAAAIRAANPSMADSVFHVTRPGRPFLVVNLTLLGPRSLVPFEVDAATVFQVTPLYFGSPHAKQIEYRGEDRTETLWVGGGFIEPFALGCAAPESMDADSITMTKPARRMTLADAAGSSSSAFAGFTELEHFGFNTLGGLAPVFSYWPVSAKNSFDAAFGDGGVLENLGLLSMLQRKVENLMVFISSEQPINVHYNPSTAPTGKDLDGMLPPLFGYPIKAIGTATTHNQVFAQSDFAQVAGGLQELKRAGRSLILTTELDVQANDWWGIEGGWRANVCWVYLDRVAEWEALLQKPIQKEIKRGNHSFLSHGAFKHFPNYRTVEEDFFRFIALTAPQVNLLADLSCWNMTSNAKRVRAFLDG